MRLAQQIIAQELREFDKHFKQAIKSRVTTLDLIMQYIVKRKGKRMRPMLVLLSAKMWGDVNDASYRAAALVELLHTATITHDDVVDDSFERRGFFSINALWKNKIAVLVGDYLLSKGLLLSLNNNDYEVLQLLAEAVRLMSEGELLQMQKARNLNLNEVVYYDIINGKTASLLAAACAAGALSTLNSKTQENNLRIKNMHLFGEKVGMAFQIKDDLLDYDTSATIGKPTGNDIKEKKLTLPLIYTLNNCSSDIRRKIIRIVKHNNEDKKAVQFVMDEVKNSGGIAYAIKKMCAFRDEALVLLETFPNNEPRRAMEELVRYTTDRTY